MKNSYLIIVGSALLSLSVQAQLTCSGPFQIGGTFWVGSGGMSNWNSCAFTATGSTTTLDATGSFLHGEDSISFNGVYMSSGVDSFFNQNEYSSAAYPASPYKVIAGGQAPQFAHLTSSAGTTGLDLYIRDTNGIIITGSLATNFRYIYTDRSADGLVLSGAVHFAAGAGYNLASLGDGQFIDGYVQTNAATSFTYPVGANGDYRPLTTSGVTGAGGPGDITVAWLPGNPDSTTDPSDVILALPAAQHPVASTGPGILAVSTAGQWDWVTTTALSGTVTVSIPDMSDFALTADLRLVGWDGSSWIDLSGAPTASDNTENSTLSGTVTPGISAIGIGSVGLALPLDLLSFTGKNNGCSAVLNWSTANEVEFSYFEVEYSRNAAGFVEIAHITGGAVSHTYTYTNAQDTTNGYYRLKMVDIDGHYKYSPVVAVQVSCGGAAIKVYPNPVRSEVRIEGIRRGTVILVVSTTGQTVAQKIAASDGPQELNISRLTDGIYSIVVLQGGNPQSIKIIKQSN